ncbi:MAG: aminotransferase class I/II-fold pyridoxal phosphate-dependent enzyme [Oceanospirillaceae bacterium]
MNVMRESNNSSLKSQLDVAQNTSVNSALHGGDIISASAQYFVPLAHWIDLSTGLNPASYPCDDVPSSAYQHLPYLQPSFLQAASSYYGSEQSIPLIGSQMLIQNLPFCVTKKAVLLPSAGYSEHRQSWQQAEFELNEYPAFDTAKAVASINQQLSLNNQQHVVVINPNNPTGLLINPQQLIKWANTLATDCYMIVDEAFIDMEPEQSVLSHQWPNNMLVLRSFGKFFGLAGIRIGFAFCRGALKQRIEQQLGLWMINGPAQYLATKAMQDTLWQQTARLQIPQAALLTQHIFAPLINSIEIPWQTHQPLFSSYQMSLKQALAVQDCFAKAGVLIRVIALDNSALNTGIEEQALLRIGILSSTEKEHQLRVSACVTACVSFLKNTKN